MKPHSKLGKRPLESDDDSSFIDGKSPSNKQGNYNKVKREKLKSPNTPSSKKRSFSPDGSVQKKNTAGLSHSPLGSDKENTPKVKRPRVSDVSVSQSKSKAEDTSKICESIGASQVVILATIRKRLEELNQRTLYIRKLPRKTTLGQLKTLCRTSINARLQSAIHSRKRHAFVEYKSAEQAQQACASLNGKLISDVPISVQICSERIQSNRTGRTDHKDTWKPANQRQLSEFQLDVLHVSCISRQATEQELRDLFPKAKSFGFFTAPKGTSIDKCNVKFANESDALEAFTTQHGVLLHNAPISVNFAFKRAIKQSQRHPDHKHQYHEQQESTSSDLVTNTKSISQTQPKTDKSKDHKNKLKEVKQPNLQKQSIIDQHSNIVVHNKQKDLEKKKKKKCETIEFGTKTNSKKISTLPTKPIVNKKKLV